MSHDLDAMTASSGGRLADEPRDVIRSSHEGGRWQPHSSARLSLVVGLVVGLLVAAAGLVYAVGHVSTWSSHQEMVIVPRTGIDLVDAASLYDSLSRGQVVATAAQVYDQSRWHAQSPEVTVTAGGIPPSAVIRVTATGTERASVSRALDEVISRATPEVNAMLSPYRAVALTDSSSAPQQIGLGSSTLMVIALLAGLFAGVLGAGAVSRLPGRRAG